jgi:hypothetical protein
MCTYTGRARRETMAKEQYANKIQLKKKIHEEKYV